MGSNEELKHLGFVEEVAVKIFATLSTLYGLKKEHEYNFLKPFCEFVETNVIFIMGPVSEKITNMSYQILIFVDGKFDMYAPTFILNLVDKFNSYTKENGISITITTATDTVINQVQEAGATIIQKGSESVTQVIDTATTIVGGIPIIGDTAQSIITTQTDAVGQIITNTTTSVKENGIFGAITSAANSVVSGVQETGSSIIQKGTDSVNQVLDTTTSVIGSIPIIGNVTNSITTETNGDTQEGDTTTSPPKKSGGFFGSMISVAGSVVKGAEETTKSVVQKGTDTVKNTVNATTSAVDSIPVVGSVLSAPIKLLPF